MTQVVYLKKGAKAPKSVNSVAIYVISKGGGSLQYATGSQTVLRVIKADADSIIKSHVESRAFEIVYVIGYHEANDRYGKKRDQLLKYMSELANK